MELAEHPSPGIRGTWLSMMQRWAMASPLEDRTSVGGPRSGIQEVKVTKGVKVTWLDTFDAMLLRELNVRWVDGCSTDTHIGDLVLAAAADQTLPLQQVGELLRRPMWSGFQTCAHSRWGCVGGVASGASVG